MLENWLHLPGEESEGKGRVGFYIFFFFHSKEKERRIFFSATFPLFQIYFLPKSVSSFVNAAFPSGMAPSQGKVAQFIGSVGVELGALFICFDAGPQNMEQRRDELGGLSFTILISRTPR